MNAAGRQPKTPLRWLNRSGQLVLILLLGLVMAIASDLVAEKVGPVTPTWVGIVVIIVGPLASIVINIRQRLRFRRDERTDPPRVWTVADRAWSEQLTDREVLPIEPGHRRPGLGIARDGR